MKDKSKMIVAVIAVVMMLGCAILPAACPDKAVAETEAQDEFSGFSLAELIEKIKEGSSDFDFGDAKLVPTGRIDMTVGESFGNVINKAETIGEGVTKSLANGTTTFENDGCITIAKGGTLALFPLLEADSTGGVTYTIINMKGDGKTAVDNDELLINAEKGAKITIAGIEFDLKESEVLRLDNGSSEDEKGTTITNPVKYAKFTAKMSLTGGTDALTMNFTMDSELNGDAPEGYIVKSEVSLMNFDFQYNAYKHKVTEGTAHDFEFNGSVKANMDKEKGITNVGVNGRLIVDSRTDDMLIQGHVDIHDVNATLIGDASVNGSIELSGKIIGNMTGDWIDDSKKEGEKFTTFFIVKNAIIDVGGVKASVETTQKNGITEVKNTVTQDGKLIVGVGYAYVDWDGKKVKVTNIALTIEDANVIITTSDDGTSTKPIYGKIAGSIALTCERIDFKMSGIGSGNEDEPFVSATVYNIEISIKGIDAEYSDGKTITAKLDAITVTLTVSKDDLIIMEEPVGAKYDVILLVQIYDVKANADISTMEMSATASLRISLGMTQDGVYKKLEIGAKGISATPVLEGTALKEVQVGIEKVYLENSLSLDILDGITYIPVEISFIKEKLAEMGLGSGNFEISFNDISYTYGKDKYPTIKTITMDAKNGIRYKQIHLQLTNPVMPPELITGDNTYGFKVKSDSVDGFILGYNGVRNDFSITDNPQVGLTVKYKSGEDPYLKAYLCLYSGNAHFEAGMIPFEIRVESGVKFYANGLTAPSFEFYNTADDRNGTVVINTDAFKMYRTSTGYMCVQDGKDDSAYHIHAEIEGGFTLKFNLKDLYNGTIEANKGYRLSDSYSNEGFSMTSSDGKTGSFTVIKTSSGKSVADSGCIKERLTFTLSYANDYQPSQQVKFGQTVKIATSEPTKEGCTFLGWSDGSGVGGLYQTGSDYVMPARDVTLTPVFGKVGTKTIVQEGEDKYIEISSDMPGVALDIEKITKEELDTCKGIIVKTSTTTILIDRTTYDELRGKVTDLKYVVFWCVKADSFNHEEIAEIVGDKNLFSMHVARFDSSGKVLDEDVDFSQSTEFGVTVNIAAGNNVKEFKVQYIDEHGVVSEVAVDNFKKCNDGTYDVMFTVNHFSLYTVEPIYGESSGDNNIAILIGLIIAIIVVCALLMAIFGKKKHGDDVA